MSDEASGLRARNLRTLALLAALFLLPLLLAFVAYYGTSWRPAGHVNHGRLISPPRPLPALPLPQVTSAPEGAAATTATPFHGRWSLVYVGDGRCEAACREALYRMRQTRLALNSDMTRVARVFVVSGECCAREFLAHEHAGLTVLNAGGGAGARLLREFPADGREHTVYVVDPLGNLMMSYDARQDPHGLLEDLKKLLRLSHIG
jgi:cytochrome oxidase Cu insertion factor (SCO1/SenC/PrrC family)